VAEGRESVCVCASDKEKENRKKAKRKPDWEKEYKTKASLME
jgi:hypothetical protein